MISVMAMILLAINQEWVWMLTPNSIRKLAWHAVCQKQANEEGEGR